jgi:hypothetical protein
MHLNIFLVKKHHFGQTALEIPFTSFLMSRLLQFAKNDVFLLEKCLNACQLLLKFF